MTIIQGVDNIHPDTEIECEYCQEESIANDRRFERVYRKLNNKKVTVIICRSCVRQLWSQGELIAIQKNNMIPTLARYEFVNNKLD